MLSKKKTETNESSSSAKASLDSIDRSVGSRFNCGITALSVPHFSAAEKKEKGEKSVIYLKMIIFKERNRRTQQILVIFYSFNGRRECSENTIGSFFKGREGGKEEKCSWWFYGSITNFPSQLCCSMDRERFFTQFFLTHTSTDISTFHLC